LAFIIGHLSFVPHSLIISMMSLKRYFAFIITVCILTSGLVLLYGCGLQPTTGTESPVINFNEGTVSGFVFGRNETRWTNIPVQGAHIYISSEAMTQESTATTDANGYYSISGLAPGEVGVTVTVDGYAQTIVQNRDTICFMIGDQSTREPGSVTIRGSCEGVQGSPSSRAISLQYASGKYSDYNSHIYSNYTFEATNILPNEYVYVMIRLQYGSVYKYYYNKVYTSGSLNLVNVDCSKNDTVDAIVVDPAGYTMKNMDAGLTYDHVIMSSFGSDIVLLDQAVVNTLAPLLAGDGYYVSFLGTNPNGDSFYKPFYNETSTGMGTRQFDLSGYVLPTNFMLSPATEESITTSTTFEWNAVSGADSYKVSVSQEDSPYYTWELYTTNTKVKIPGKVFAQMPTSGPTNYYRVDVVAYCGMNNYGGISRQDLNSPNYWGSHYVGANRLVHKL
jgi:hypothetical protein